MCIVGRGSLGLLLLAACSDGSSRIEFVGLRDGAVLGGPQTTTVEPDIPDDVEHVSLFLDGDLIGMDERAPYTFEWDTTGFGEGPVELRAEAYVAGGSAPGRTPDDRTPPGPAPIGAPGGGSSVSASIEIVIDNTPPVIVGLPDNVNDGDIETVEVTDANRIVRVELEGPGGLSRTWTAPPFNLTWDGQCGVAEVTITAVDEAGWSTVATDTVETVVQEDEDCDTYDSAESLGPDCNDADPTIHPGAVDEGPLGDVNCDGVPGTDADGDGIAAIGAGGRDCDDTDPAIHPGGTIYHRQLLAIDGQSIEWEPGTATNVQKIEDNGFRTSLVAINRDGTLELVTAPALERPSRRVLLTGINPGKVAFAAPGSGRKGDNNDLYIFYGRGNELRAHISRSGAWSDELVLTADGAVEEPVAEIVTFQQPEMIVRFVAVAARAGTSIYIGRDEGMGWRSQVLVSDPALTQAPVDLAESGFPPGVGHSVAYVAGTSLEVAELAWDSTTPALSSIGTVTDPAGMVGLCYEPLQAVAFHAQDGCIVESGSPPEPVTPCADPIERLFCLGSEVYFQRTTGVVGHYRHFDGSIEYVGATADSASTGGAFEITFATPGAIYRLDHFVFSPEDPVDGIDRNCDGQD
jgi:hypothetical protein